MEMSYSADTLSCKSRNSSASKTLLRALLADAENMTTSRRPKGASLVTSSTHRIRVVTTVFKAIHDTAPAHLQEVIVPYAPSRGLRSREHNLLCVPFTRSTVAGNRAFSMAGPKLWNALPPVVSARHFGHIHF